MGKAVPDLAIHLLGSPRIEFGGKPLTLERRKSLALLVYLALLDRPVRRDSLASLLWPDSSQSQARGALRRHLSDLKTAVRIGWPQDGVQTLSFPGDAGLWLDVKEFHARLALCRSHGHLETEACEACQDPLVEAAGLYQGPFLSGFSLPDSPDFDSWQFFQSESLQREVESVLSRLVLLFSARKDFPAAIRYAHRWAALDPCSEDAHRQLMKLYVWTGRPNEALRQYRQCAETLQSELDVVPEHETTSLYQAIKERRSIPLPSLTDASAANRREPPPIEAGPAYNLPLAPTPFIGREHELAEISRLLRSPECRLLTLVGPGGMGKTRLALEAAAQHAADFADGACFVPLARTSSADQLALAIANALGFSLRSSGDQTGQLARYLGDRQLLLVLDNFEHLIEGVHVIAGILGAAPSVKAIATSHVPLSLHAEWTFDVGGMQVPFSEASPQIEGYPSVELFLISARRINSTFQLRDDDKPHVARICRLAQGMPLAVELAAAWAKSLTCREIAEEMERNLDFLQIDLHDAPLRHRSMRALFDYSWDLLSAEEQQAFAALSVFQGGCSRQAAQRVTGTSLQVLKSLLHRLLLRQNSAGDRYELHELLRQFAAERLREMGLEAKMRERQSSYYAAALAERAAQLKSTGQLQALDEIEQDFANVRLAWSWAVEHRMYTRLDRAAESLRLFGKMRSRFVEVESLLRGAFEALGPRRGADPHPTWALIGSWHQLFLVELRQPHQAAERMAAWLELFERSGDADKAAHASLALAQALMREGIFPESLEHLERSLHLFEELKDPFWRAQALHSLGYYQAATGNWTAFETSIRQSLDLYRQIGAVLGQSEALENLASAIYAAGEYQRGEEYLLEAHELRRRLRNAHGVAYTGAGLAEMAFFRGDFEAARQRVGEAVSLALEVSDPESMGYARVILGYLACADGRFQEGLDLYAEALHVDPNSPFIKMSCAWGRALAHLGLEDWESLRAGLLASVDPAMELGGPAHLLAWLPFAAVLNAREGRLEEALALAALVRRQPAAIAGWIRLFRPLARRLKHMEKEAPAGSMDGAQRKAGELKPAAALQSYLERHQRPEHER